MELFSKFSVLVMGIGLSVFIYVYYYSVGIFEWIERQTFGTRTYILEKFELLFIKVNPEHITYVLLFLSLGLGVISFAIIAVFGSWFLATLVGPIIAFIGFKVPRPVVDKMVQIRIKRYQAQLVDGLQLLANGLRAGLSVPQSLGMTVDELGAPLSQEFGLILQQNRLGVPLEECFENLLKRVPTEDNEMFVSSVNILRETGGNLAETFDTIVEVIRERIRLEQKIDQYTTTGKFQGYVIACMPFLILFIFGSSNPESVYRIFESPIGWLLFLLSLSFDLVGLLVILKIVKIKV